VGTAQIKVRNPDGATSNATTFTIRTTPATPNFVGATTDVEAHTGVSTIRRLQIVGSGIQPGVTLNWNGRIFQGEASYPFVGFQIPENLMLTPGPVDLLLTNPGGSPSNVLRLNV